MNNTINLNNHFKELRTNLLLITNAHSVSVYHMTERRNMKSRHSDLQVKIILTGDMRQKIPCVYASLKAVDVWEIVNI